MALKGKTVERPDLIEGMVTAQVVAVQPSSEDIEKLTDGQLSVPDSPSLREVEYDGEDPFVQMRVRFLLKITADDNPVVKKDNYQLMDFYITDKPYHTKKGGYWIGTSAGETGYCVPSDGDEETALVEVFEGKIKLQEAKTVVLKDGEMELFTFLSKLFNINPKSEDVDVNYKELFFEDVIKGEHDFASLQDELDEREPKVVVMAYVDARKGYQKIDVRSALNTIVSTTDKGYVTRLTKHMKNQHDKGYKLVKGAANEVVIQRVYDPSFQETDEGIDSAADMLSDAVV